MRTYSALRSQVHTVAVPVPPMPTSTPITTSDPLKCSVAAGSRSAKIELNGSQFEGLGGFEVVEGLAKLPESG